MKWSLDFPIPPNAFPISHQSKILSLGSCFAQTIGQKMAQAKLDCLINPFGIVFHPLNLADLLDSALFDDPMDEEGVLERDGLYFHYSTHSDVFGYSREELRDSYRSRIRHTKAYLESGTHLILTLGTAWIYEHHQFGRVANCHKQAQTLFRKSLSTLKEMEMGLGLVLDNFSRAFPKLKIILTLSPVRHIKDGLPENQLSKSLLRVLCANLERRLESVTYFPAYEIMMDELRDYRFYKADLIHPSEEAENHIWEKWKAAHFDSKTNQKVTEIQKIQLELTHRPLNPASASHRIFLEKLQEKLERLNTEFDFSRELAQINSKLKSSADE